MSEKHEYLKIRRETTLSEIRNAKQRLKAPPATMLARVALGVVYMYLILMSYELLGASGPVFISVTFLVAFFIPWTYKTVGRRLAKRQARDRLHAIRKETQPEA